MKLSEAKKVVSLIIKAMKNNEMGTDKDGVKAVLAMVKVRSKLRSYESYIKSKTSSNNVIAHVSNPSFRDFSHTVMAANHAAVLLANGLKRAGITAKHFKKYGVNDVTIIAGGFGDEELIEKALQKIGSGSGGLPKEAFEDVEVKSADDLDLDVNSEEELTLGDETDPLTDVNSEDGLTLGDETDPLTDVNSKDNSPFLKELDLSGEDSKSTAPSQSGNPFSIVDGDGDASVKEGSDSFNFGKVDAQKIKANTVTSGEFGTNLEALLNSMV